ncbi:hypothetical protein [Salipiger abyssi]|uniref:hypothetical protein n=1 Tax=Salipiger abyssi TaxID=1250539 RepID=UPI001A8F09FB|nr:hypothetical protein [Salipiger abyssi]MBN9890157.1 hypothetical protein [Salipiger abyssi]
MAHLMPEFNRESPKGMNRAVFQAVVDAPMGNIGVETSLSLPLDPRSDIERRMDGVTDSLNSRALLDDEAFKRSVQILMQSSGLPFTAVLAGLMARSGAEATMQATDEAQKKAQEQSDDVLFLELLDRLNEEIEVIRGEIDVLNKQIAAIDELLQVLAEQGDLDPTNPQHQRLLQAAGVPVDDWGIVNEDYLNELREDRVTEKTRKEARLDDLNRLHDDAQREMAEGTLTSEKRQEYLDRADSYGVSVTKSSYQEKGTSLAADGVEKSVDAEIARSSVEFNQLSAF